ncbi:MAG: hypothetical protein NTW21_05645 [Verrucomicrobia bacterium]|nr:hypothetical protein [Verrucomicrobiota bacterium]
MNLRERFSNVMNFEKGVHTLKWEFGYPQLQMLGGVPKGEISRGKAAIDNFLGPVAEVLKTGGYVPFVDHLVPPDVDWDNLKYYRTTMNRMIEQFGE